MGLDILANITDPYERKARLYPISLPFIPFAVLVVGLYTFHFDKAWIPLIATFGAFYLLARISRNRGKKIETTLFDSWGGKPSTQLLRHRDKQIDKISKLRYHAVLSKLVNVDFPTESDESDNPTYADNIYESAVKYLIEQTRDQKKYKLLFNENIEYGFLRNSLGCKPLGIVIAFISIIWVFVSLVTISVSSTIEISMSQLPTGAIVSLFVSVIMLWIWLSYFTRNSVRIAAFTYAETLLRACDSLSTSTKPKR